LGKLDGNNKSIGIKKMKETKKIQEILLIEDERLHRITTMKILSDSGYKVITAEDGCQGFHFALEHKPSVIILDLGLPAGGGLLLLKRMKKSVYTRNIPVIVLTAMQSQKYKSEILDVGVEAFLEKPCPENILLSTIQEVLKKTYKNQGVI
jgi:DNA-binding response OmpR family regulator